MHLQNFFFTSADHRALTLFSFALKLHPTRFTAEAIGKLYPLNRNYLIYTLAAFTKHGLLNIQHGRGPNKGYFLPPTFPSITIANVLDSVGDTVSVFSYCPLHETVPRLIRPSLQPFICCAFKRQQLLFQEFLQRQPMITLAGDLEASLEAIARPPEHNLSAKGK